MNISILQMVFLQGLHSGVLLLYNITGDIFFNSKTALKCGNTTWAERGFFDFSGILCSSHKMFFISHKKFGAAKVARNAFLSCKTNWFRV